MYNWFIFLFLYRFGYYCRFWGLFLLLSCITVRIPYKYESILNRDPWEMSHMLQKQGKVELIMDTCYFTASYSTKFLSKCKSVEVMGQSIQSFNTAPLHKHLNSWILDDSKFQKCTTQVPKRCLMVKCYLQCTSQSTPPPNSYVKVNQ